MANQRERELAQCRLGQHARLSSDVEISIRGTWITLTTLCLRCDHMISADVRALDYLKEHGQAED